VIDVEHDGVAAGVASQAEPQRRPLAGRDDLAVEPATGRVQCAVVGAVDDLQGVSVKGIAPEHGLRRLSEASLVDGPGHADLELHAPQRCSWVEQVALVGLGLRGLPDPLAVQLAPMVALTPP
jgi:hypothetical protein